ncbi:hypothetical protein V6C27_08185 [Peptococcaceae bacterium 1198_IL3148]
MGYYGGGGYGDNSWIVFLVLILLLMGSPGYGGGYGGGFYGVENK